MKHIKLANDYSVRLPVSVYDEEGEMLSGVESLLSDGLARDLRAWASRFNSEYDFENGWPSLERCKVAYREGKGLRESLQKELKDAEVSFEFWELQVDGVDHELSELE